MPEAQQTQAIEQGCRIVLGAWQQKICAACKIGTFLGPNLDFGPIWDQVPKLGTSLEGLHIGYTDEIQLFKPAQIFFFTETSSLLVQCTQVARLNTGAPV